MVSGSGPYEGTLDEKEVRVVYIVEPGDEPKIYVFPADAGEDWEMPADFWQRVRSGLASVGLAMEPC